MSVEEFMAVVPPPEHPLEVGNQKKWDEIQSKLGLSLPRDYYDFAMRYGTGSFGIHYLRVYNPFSNNYKNRLDEQCDLFQGETHLIAYNEWFDEPYAVYPEVPGLFPWGDDSNAYHLCWYTDGEPDEWPILVIPREREPIEEFKMPMTTFLVKAFTNEIKYGNPAEPFDDEDRVFRPIPPRSG